MAQSREIEKLQRRWQENPLGLTFAPLAEAYRKEGMHEEALELLELGLAQHPNYVPAHIVSARCQLDIGQDGKAEAAFRRVADLDPENVIALRGVADIAERGGRFQEAATRLEALLLFDRNNEEARSHLARVRALLAMPTPGTIDPDAVTVEAATPEQASPIEVPDVPVAPEPTVSISMPEPEPEPEPEAEPEPEQAPVAEPVEQAVDLTGMFVEDEVDAVDAGAAAAVSSGAIVESIEAAAPADPVTELVEPDEAAASEAGVGADEEVEPLPEPADDLDDGPPAVEAAVLADPDLDVELYHPMELTAASSTEYQQSSDAEALRGGGAQEAGEPGERVPLFVAGSEEPGPPEPSAEETTPVAAALDAEPDDSAADEETAGDESGDGADEPELVVTETMAEVFLRQGHRELALAVYAQLRQREPDNARIQSAIDDLERELRPAHGTSMPAFAAALTGGRSVRGYFEDLLTAPVPAPNGGDGLALGSVFGDEPGAAPEPEAEPEGGPSFDEFFAGDAPEPAATPGAEALPAPASEDIEEFNAWLRGLKR